MLNSARLRKSILLVEKSTVLVFFAEHSDEEDELQDGQRRGTTRNLIPSRFSHSSSKLVDEPSSFVEEDVEHNSTIKMVDDLDVTETSTRDGTDRGSFDGHFDYESEHDYESTPGLIAVGEILRRGVKHRYRFSLDREIFYANEAVDYLVDTGLASSRTDAASIGQLLEVAGLIECLAAPQQKRRNAGSTTGSTGNYKHLSTWEVRNSYDKPCCNEEDQKGYTSMRGTLLKGISRRSNKFKDARTVFHFCSVGDWKRRRESMEETRDFFLDNMDVGEHAHRM